MFKYAPNKGELASRDVVSRAEWTEILEGRGVDGCVLLDMRHLGREKILERLPQIRELALDATGKDAINEPIPILPGRALHDGRHRDRQVGRDAACRACTPPASARASAFTAPTDWAATRCSRRSSSALVRPSTRSSTSRRPATSNLPTRTLKQEQDRIADVALAQRAATRSPQFCATR